MNETSRSRASSEAVDFVDLMSCYPTGVTIVTTTTANGFLFGMTCSSMLSVTLRPPTLLVSLRSESPTLEAIRERGGFAVNLLGADGAHAAKVFSTPTPARFSKIKWRESPALRVPWLVDHAFASADCVISDSYPVGDHTLVLGRVVDIELSIGQPLLYGQRRYSVFPSGEHAAR